MAYLTLIITIPLSLFALAFAASNSDAVKVGLWPLDQTWNIPLSIIGLAMLGLGFLSGSLFIWILYQRLRFRHWQHSRKISRLEKELDSLNKKVEEGARTDGNQPAGTAVVPK